MTTWTAQTKNSTTWHPRPKKGGGLTWEEATMRWVDADFTWEEVGSTTWTGITKNTTSWTAQSKS